MKYAIIIMDGAADEAIESLGGKTPLEAAQLPNCNAIALQGRLGLLRTIPEGFPPGSDVAQMSIMGYDPRQFYSGRAPLEAAAQGIQCSPSDWIFRCNLVTIADGVMVDYSAGHIDSVQAKQLIEALNAQLGNERIQFYPGVSYRHLMIHRGGPFDGDLTPPHDILDKPVKDYLPKCKNGKELCKLMEGGEAVLAEHEINKVRADLGENRATHIWLWGQGHRPQMDSFRKKYKVHASVITAVDVMRGIARLAGLKTIDVPGATGYLDTNYAGKGQAAIEALKGDVELMVVHVEAPDEASHGAMLAEKIQSLEAIDKYVVGPIWQWLKSQDEWRIMVLPDHPTPIRLRTHAPDSVPAAIAGTNIANTIQLAFNEPNARKSGFRVERGHELMEYFLHGKG